MKKYVVLFNLETNMYMETTKPFATCKDWKEAMIFPDEDTALNFLQYRSKIIVENKLNNWCTRTFYNLN